MNTQPILDSVIAKANAKQTRADEDYTHNGLLYCGKCHTPKQSRGAVEGKVVPITCRCAEEEAAKEEAEKTRKQREELRKKCLPLERQRKQTFSGADNSDAIRIALKYVEKWEELSADNTGLVFYGNVGTGKSYAALCIANALIDKGIPVRYVSAAEIVGELMSRDTNSKKYIEELCSRPLLIIDDLGAEHSSAFSQSLLCRVIEDRRESGKPFICTTNYSMDEMQNPTDPTNGRMFDRLLASCVPVLVTAEHSRRIREGADRLERARRLLQ